MSEERESANEKSYFSYLLTILSFFNRLIYKFFCFNNSLILAREAIDPVIEQSRIKIISRIKSNTRISHEYLTMNIFATIIACCGLATNNSIVIMGAMTLAMLLGPIMGVSLAIIDGDRHLLTKAIFTLMAGVFVVLATSFMFSIFYRFHITNLPESNLMQYAAPNLLDLVVAIIGGAAGAYAALSREIRLGLAGVALSITMLPPLAACGIFLSHGNIGFAFGSFTSFLTNFIAVQFTASVVFWIYGFRRAYTENTGMLIFLKKNKLSVLLIFMLAILLSVNLQSVVGKLRFEQEVKTEVRAGLKEIPDTFLADIRFLENNKIVAVVRSPDSITKKQVAKIRARLPARNGAKPHLSFRVVKVSIITANEQT